MSRIISPLAHVTFSPFYHFFYISFGVHARVHACLLVSSPGPLGSHRDEPFSPLGSLRRRFSLVQHVAGIDVAYACLRRPSMPDASATTLGSQWTLDLYKSRSSPARRCTYH
jgi:hypothetical protein